MTTKKPVNLLKGEQSQFPVQVVPGMRVLRYDYVRLVDINATNQNWGRISGVTTAGRDGIRRMIQDGTYLPQHFEPPVIDQDGNLIAGKHRFDAHDAEGEEYMWVAVCEFDDDDARNTYANDENMRNTFKTMQTPEDFIFAHAQIVKRGDKVSKTKNAVSNYIKRNYPQLPMNYPSRSKLAEEILITAGVDFVPIEIMTDEKIISEYYEEYGIDIVEDPSYILKKLTGAKDDDDFCEKLVDWADIIRKTFYEGGIDDVVTTRRLVHIVNAFRMFKDKMKSIEMCISRFDEETRNSILDLYTKVDDGVHLEDESSETFTEEVNFESDENDY
jgi:hypothetical protein